LIARENSISYLSYDEFGTCENDTRSRAADNSWLTIMHVRAHVCHCLQSVYRIIHLSTDIGHCTITNSTLIASLQTIDVQSTRSVRSTLRGIRSNDNPPGGATKHRLPWQHSPRDRETDFRRIIYSHSSTNRDNFAKFGPADFEIIVRLTRIRLKITNK